MPNLRRPDRCLPGGDGDASRGAVPRWATCNTSLESVRAEQAVGAGARRVGQPARRAHRIRAWCGDDCPPDRNVLTCRAYNIAHICLLYHHDRSDHSARRLEVRVLRRFLAWRWRTSGSATRVVARTRGGHSRADNIVVACWSCNAAKGEALLEDVFPSRVAEVQRRLARRLDRAAGRVLGDELYPWAEAYRAREAEKSLARYRLRRARIAAEPYLQGTAFPFGGGIE